MTNRTSISNINTDTLDALPVAAIIFDNNRIHYINKAGFTILGIKHDLNFLKTKRSIFDFLLPEYHQRIRKNNIKILGGEKFDRIDFSIKIPKGTIIDIECRSNLVWYNGKKAIQTVILEITSRKRYEKELLETGEMFNLLNKHANDIFFKFDFLPKPSFSFISDSLNDVLGYNKKDFISNPNFYERVIHPEDKKKFIFTVADYKRFVQTKQTTNTIRFFRKNKSLVWLETVYTPIKDDKGNIHSIIGISRDVSAYKQTEEQLREANEKFNLISKHAKEIIYFFTYQPKAKYLYISASVQNVLGYAPEDFYKDAYLINKKTIGKTNDLKAHEIVAAKQQKNNNFKSRSVIYQVKTKAGDVLWMEDNVSPIRDETGKIKFFFGIVRNITELKEKESELNQKWSDYKELLDESPMAFFIHDNGICRMGNKEAVKILKIRSAESIYGKSLLEYIIPEQRQGALARMKDVLQGKELDFVPYQIVNSKGERISVELKSVPVKYNDVPSVLTMIQDVTQKQRYAREKLRAEIAEEHNKELIKEIGLRKKAEDKLKHNEALLVNQAAKLGAIFESSSHLVWTVNSKFELTYFNNNFRATFKSKYGVSPVLGKRAFDIIGEKFKKENKDLWYPNYDKVLGGEQVIFERKDKDKKGQDIYREVFLSPIKNENGKVFEIACLAHDITERKKFEKQNSEQASKIKAIFDGSSHYVWTINSKNELTSFNENYAKLIKRIYNIESKIGTVINKGKMVSKLSYNEWWNNKYKSAFRGEIINFETAFTDKAGNKVHLDVYLNPVYNGKEIVEVSGIAHDITERIQNEEQIKEQTAKLKAIFESGSQLIWTINAKKEITSFNQNYANAIYKLYGFYPVENKSIRVLDNGASKPYQEFWDEKYSEAFAGNATEFTTERYNMDGTKVFRQYVLYPIKDNNNQVLEVSGLGIDITENKLYEERITQSLKEKEILLKEVHHRVKNNMQVISSILNLQSSYVTDNYALNLLKESQNRIKTMAYIHESLYQNKTFSSINFSDYITTLTNNILHSYTASIQKVKLVLDIQKVILNLDTSIPAGLIINELVTNCIKHAFNDEKEGIIFINLYNKDNVLFLEVSDNGKGFPEEIDFKNTNSLGLQLVNTLVEQLNGTIELRENKNKGTGFFINFPM